MQDTNNPAGAEPGRDRVFCDAFTVDQLGNRTEEIGELDITEDGDVASIQLLVARRTGLVRLSEQRRRGRRVTVLAEQMVDTDDVETNDT